MPDEFRLPYQDYYAVSIEEYDSSGFIVVDEIPKSLKRRPKANDPLRRRQEDPDNDLISCARRVIKFLLKTREEGIIFKNYERSKLGILAVIFIFFTMSFFNFSTQNEFTIYCLSYSNK
jgi:hypothetical protein